MRSAVSVDLRRTCADRPAIVARAWEGFGVAGDDEDELEDGKDDE